VSGPIAVSSDGLRYVVTDYSWGYTILPLGPLSETPPPVGPSWQRYPVFGAAPARGTPVSAGQLVAYDVIMCKYVYPGDVDPRWLFEYLLYDGPVSPDFSGPGYGG